MSYDIGGKDLHYSNFEAMAWMLDEVVSLSRERTIVDECIEPYLVDDVRLQQPFVSMVRQDTATLITEAAKRMHRGLFVVASDSAPAQVRLEEHGLAECFPRGYVVGGAEGADPSPFREILGRTLLSQVQAAKLLVVANSGLSIQAARMAGAEVASLAPFTEELEGIQRPNYAVSSYSELGVMMGFGAYRLYDRKDRIVAG